MTHKCYKQYMIANTDMNQSWNQSADLWPQLWCCVMFVPVKQKLRWCLRKISLLAMCKHTWLNIVAIPPEVTLAMVNGVSSCGWWLWLENWVVVSNMFYFHPYLGKIPILTNILQMGWNHQLEKVAIGTLKLMGQCEHFLDGRPSKRRRFRFIVFPSISRSSN